MTDKKFLDRLKAELEDWRARVEHLRVQANLGSKEARDKLRELGDKLEPAAEKARHAIETAAASGASEAKTLCQSLQAGWDEVRRSHRELSQQAEKKGPPPSKSAGT
jgi:hypothetical protein